MKLSELLSMPVDDLLRQARVGYRLFSDATALIEHFAESMANELRANNQRGEPTRWILPVGPVKQYPRLVEISNRERISWKNVFTFQMDEFLDWQGRPLPLDHPLSFEGFMRREVFGRLDEGLRPDAANTHFPSPFQPDAISERIREAGGVDTCYGGIGTHGHVAFNEPPISRWREIRVEELRNSLTRVVVLGEDSLVVQSIHSSGGSAELIPPMAVTLGMKDILAARRIRLFLAGGERHRAVFRITLGGDVSVRYPSTLLQGHPDCIVHTAEATAQPIHPTLIWG
ncbi:MAG: 6-phosphogluconolactonase [Terriglobia bacterium]